ncbi:MAG: VanZ family protein [Candidatus Omnitrophica bacterium]|nr:VanZ family protein [Candidatus Omnitrophota bacterium]
MSVRKQAWVYVALYAGLIFSLSSLERPLPALERFQKYHLDFLLHVVEYGILGALLARALGLSFESRAAWEIGVAAFWIGCLYGATDEWHQSFVRYREASVWDWAADAGGVLLGTFLWIDRKEKTCPK